MGEGVARSEEERGHDSRGDFPETSGKGKGESAKWRGKGVPSPERK